MALVKFSAMIAIASAVGLWPTDRQPAERQVGRRLQDGADPQAGRRADRRAPRSRRQSRRASSAASPTPLTMAAYSLRVNPRSITNGAVMAPGQRVGELEQHHEGQHGEGHLVAEEILERADGGLDHAREPLLMGMRGLRLARALRLGGDQRGGGADQHQRRHRHIAPVPGRLLVEAVSLEAAHQEQRAGGRDQHADAIGRHVGRHAGGLLVLRQALDAEGVDHDVLRRRRRRHQQRAERHQAGRHRRIAGAEKEHDRRHQQDLREHQPAAAAAEPTPQ